MKKLSFVALVLSSSLSIAAPVKSFDDLTEAQKSVIVAEMKTCPYVKEIDAKILAPIERESFNEGDDSMMAIVKASKKSKDFDTILMKPPGFISTAFYQMKSVKFAFRHKDGALEYKVFDVGLVNSQDAYFVYRGKEFFELVKDSRMVHAALPSATGVSVISFKVGECFK